MDTQTKSENLNLAQKLIDAAIKGEHSIQDRLNSFAEYKSAKIVYSATRKVANGFQTGANELWTKYTNNLKNNIDDVEVLFNYKKMQQCAYFYKDDCKLLKDIIHEYKMHMLKGNLFSALLGYRREDYE